MQQKRQLDWHKRHKDQTYVWANRHPARIPTHMPTQTKQTNRENTGPYVLYSARPKKARQQMPPSAHTYLHYGITLETALG